MFVDWGSGRLYTAGEKNAFIMYEILIFWWTVYNLYVYINLYVLYYNWTSFVMFAGGALAAVLSAEHLC